jgi:hypothetical protein
MKLFLNFLDNFMSCVKFKKMDCVFLGIKRVKNEVFLLILYIRKERNIKCHTTKIFWIFEHVILMTGDITKCHMI